MLFGPAIGDSFTRWPVRGKDSRRRYPKNEPKLALQVGDDFANRRLLLPASRKRAPPGAPPLSEEATGYGVGSWYDPPKMSELPKVAEQSC
jgi:hypothetical protein